MSLTKLLNNGHVPIILLAVSLTASAAPAATYTVNPNGSGNFATIQAAIDSPMVGNGDVIMLGSGTFTGAGNRDVNFQGKAITVESVTGDPADCIIDCQGGGRGFLFINNEETTSVLRGVTIMNGVAPGTGALAIGGGIRCGQAGFPPLIPERHGSPTIENCVLLDNSANSGGGMALTNDSSPDVKYCVFESNSLGWMIGTHQGGGMYCLESDPSVEHCLFVDNTTGNQAGPGGGVYCESSAPVFYDCVFLRNTGGSGGGIASNVSTPSISYCTFNANSAGQGAGLYYYGSTLFPNSIAHCTFYGNEASISGAGIVCTYYASLTVQNSIITMSPDGEAVWTANGGSVQIQHCDVYGNAGGPGSVAGQMGSSSNFSAYPGFCGPGAGDLTLRAASPCAPANSPCGHQIGAWPVACSGPLTYSVCPDGSADFITIQAAIDAVINGDTVELCDATFTGAGNRDLDFRGKAITVISASGDPANCIIDCQGTPNNPHRGFHFHSGESSSSLLAAVTITNGHVGPSSDGGAILCDGGSSPTILYCNLIGNHSEYAGGAIACANGSSPRIEDCLISENTSISHGGGMVCSANSNPHLVFCTFSGNAAQDDGGGLAAFGQVLVETCRFEHNTTIAHGGGATFMGDAAGSQIVYTIFADNHATPPNWGAGGGVSTWVPDILFDYCTFDGNTAVSEGGAAYSDALFTNCTFNENSAPVGGGLWGNPTLDHSIIAFGAQGAAVAVAGTITDCDVFGNAGGPGTVAGQVNQNGNFALDPIFCGPASPLPLTIRSDSPCAPANSPSGLLIGAWLVDCDSPCPEDINGDNNVDVQDLLLLLAAWGNTGGPEDINGDGLVDVQDLLMLLAAWGPCP